MSNRKSLNSISKGFFSNTVIPPLQQTPCADIEDDLPNAELCGSFDNCRVTAAHWVVLFWDRQCSRLKLIDRAVAECGATSLFLQELADVDRAQRSISCCAAIVALGQCPIEDTLGLEVIRRLKNRGFMIISYEQDSTSWPLGVRCKALLAGASYVLDSGKIEFIQELQRILVGMFAQKQRETNEEIRTRDLMLDFGHY